MYLYFPLYKQSYGVIYVGDFRTVRLLVMFDLPTENHSDVKNYTKFRKFLIKEGYFMMQYSVYCKIVVNRDSVKWAIQAIKKNLPPSGSVCILQVTEKQYQSMQLLSCRDEMMEKKISVDNLLIF